MKKCLSVFVLITTLCNLVYGQQYREIKVPGNPSDVTVYLNGAELRTINTMDVKKGSSKITFEGLSPYLQDKSVQVTANGNVGLVSVTISKVILHPEEVNQQLKKLNRTIHDLKQQIKMVENQMDAYESEKQALKRNEYIGGSQTGVSLTELSKAADFFRERNLKINTALATLETQLEGYKNRYDSASNVFANASSKIIGDRKEVSVMINSEVDQKVDFILRYIVSNTGWTASYDLVARDVNEPVSLKYKAEVYNNTAIDWKDVKLTLSTGDPTLGATRPYLTSWILNYSSQANEGLVEYKVRAEAMALDTAVDYDNVAVSELSTSFPIAKPYSIPANAEPCLLEISSSTLNASYEYLTIPKVDLSAFLLAKVTGWEKLNLIDGNANVYFGNTYIGQSRVDTRLIADTLELSLGRDNQIVVTRAKLEDQGDTKLIGTRRTESFTYEIVVKNNHKTPVNIKVQDQIPISQESDITVDVENTSGAMLDNLSGRLQWVKNLSAGENVKYRISFSVKYPKGRSVAIRKQRYVRTPRYRN